MVCASPRSRDLLRGSYSSPMKEWRSFLRECRGKSSQDYVLTSHRGKPWRKQHTQHFRRAVARSGLPSDLVFHWLRHTYASDLVRRGVPLEIVAKQLGHASSITVSKTYGHLSEQYREEQIRRSFSPLSAELIQVAYDMRHELDALWSNVQATDWRQYASQDRITSVPHRSFARPSPEIAIYFGEVEQIIYAKN